MPDANELVRAMKRTAIDAVEASKPVNVYFGEVIAVSPLKINMEQKMTLEEAHLTLSRNVINFKTQVTIGTMGKQEIIMHNALTVGDKVLLIRQQKGQKYIVIDRIGVM